MPLGRSELPALIREARAAIEIGNKGAAFLLLHRAEGLAPSPEGWRAIGDAWHAAGNVAAGGTAHLRAARASVRDPELTAASDALSRNALEEADALLQARIAAHPTDIGAMQLLAELANRQGYTAEADDLLHRALALAPDFERGRYDLARSLHRQERSVEALAQVDRLLADHPKTQAYRDLKAEVLGALGG